MSKKKSGGKKKAKNKDRFLYIFNTGFGLENPHGPARL